MPCGMRPGTHFGTASADLEVYAEVERQTSVVRRVERVVTDVRQTDVVCYVEVEQVVSHAASYAQTSVKALECIVGERAESLALVIVLHLAAHAACQISAELRLHGEVVGDAVDVFQHDGHLYVVEVVGHLLLLAHVVYYVLLSAFLGVEESRLKVERNVGRQRNAHHCSYGQSWLASRCRRALGRQS